MMVNEEREPKLCPNCPRRAYLYMVRAQSYTTTPTIDPTVKLCARLRALDLPHVPQCPYFSDKEKITNFFDNLRKGENMRRFVIPADEMNYYRGWTVNGYYVFTWRRMTFRAYCLTKKGKGYSAVVKEEDKKLLHGVVISDKEFYQHKMTVEQMAHTFTQT